jgi:hypothetical protein
VCYAVTLYAEIHTGVINRPLRWTTSVASLIIVTPTFAAYAPTTTSGVRWHKRLKAGEPRWTNGASTVADDR